MTVYSFIWEVMMKIEYAQHKHAPEIVLLMDELGYQCSLDLIESKLKFIDDSGGDQVFVATIDGKVVGVISCHITILFQAAGACGRITSLVVSSHTRGKGIGKALLIQADKYFLEKNCVKVEVTSSKHRKEAHDFYKAVGYKEESARFLKSYN